MKYDERVVLVDTPHDERRKRHPAPSSDDTPPDAA
jgi:hypothetical protein